MADPIDNGEREAAVVSPITGLENYGFEFAVKKMLACRLFIQGACEKGNCRLYHPSPENLATAINSPPLPPEFGTDNITEDDGEIENGVKERKRLENTGRLRFTGQGRSLPTRFSALRSQFNYPQPYNTTRQSYSLDRNDFLQKSRHRSPRSFQQRQYEPKRGNMNPNIQHYYPPVPSYENDFYYDMHSHEREMDFAEYGYPPYNDFDLESEDLETPLYSESDTLFNHIQWSQFLAPGQLPPPLVAVPEQNDSPQRKGGRNLLQMMKHPGDHEDQLTKETLSGKMNVKQEFRFMVERVAAGIGELSVAESENAEYEEVPFSSTQGYPEPVRV